MYYTHLAFAFLAALLSIEFLSVNTPILFLLIVLFFSVFPDIDYSKSKIGQKNKLLSRTINFFFGHRGFFHSVWIPLIFFIIFYNFNLEIGVAALLGYASHLFLDSLTRTGINPLFPLIDKKFRWFIKTNSLMEKMLFFVIFFTDIYLTLNYIL